MNDYIKLTRPVNFAITFATGAVAYFISIESSFSWVILLLVSLSAALTASGGNIINDYFDIETDKINKPERPLASGKVSKASALALYITLNVIALIFSLFINPLSFLIVILSQLLLLVYSYQLKRRVLVGNIAVALLTGMVFIYGGAAAGSMKNAIVPALFAFLINLVRELLKDIEDIKGDKEAGLMTLPIKYNTNFSRWIIFSVTIILILFTFHPFIFSYYKIEFFLIIMAVVNPVLIYFLKSVFEDLSTKNLHKLSNLLKLNMLFGLIAIYMGK